MLIIAGSSLVHGKPMDATLQHVSALLEMSDTLKKSGIDHAEVVHSLSTHMESHKWSNNITSPLAEVTQKLEDKVLAKILSSHSETQTEINSLANDLVLKNNDANSKFSQAQLNATDLYDCHSDEHDYLVTRDAAMTEIARLTPIKTDTCTKAATKSVISITKTASAGDDGAGTFVCNVLADSDCSGMLTQFDKQVKDDAQDLQDDAQVDFDDYKQEKSNCTTQTDLISTQDGIKSQAGTDWQQQKNDCDTNHKPVAKTKMCAYRTAQQAQCDALQAYNDLIDQVKGSGNVHSDSNRKTEYQTFKQAICLIKKIRDATNNCDADFDLEQEVTKLDLKSNTVAGIECTNSQIKFSDLKWNRADRVNGNPPSATAYTEVNADQWTLTSLNTYCR